MIELFQEESELCALQFFNANRARITLLSTPSFTAQLYYAEKALLSKGRAFDFPVVSLNIETFSSLKAEDDAVSGKVYVVADPEGETQRLEQLQVRYPNLRFVGLGRDLLPALVAKANHMVFEEIRNELKVHTITLAIATPRSGSSLLADLLSDIGVGRVTEHLRDDVISVVNSEYKFDFSSALRNFLNFASVEGRFGTKLISHFLMDYLTKTRNLRDVVEVCAGVKLKVIFLDREDRAAQTISGYLAAKRKIWHVTSAKHVAELQATPMPELDFNRALSRYFLYCQQSSILNSLRPMFPDALSLVYERDLLDSELDNTAGRLENFVELDGRPAVLKKASQRQRISDSETAKMVQEFKVKFSESFGVAIR